MENLSEIDSNQENKPLDSKKRWSRNIAIVGLSLSVILSGIAVGTYFSNRSAQELADASSIFSSDSLNSGNQANNDTSWVPAGYTAWSNDPSVAWKWTQGSCSDYTCNHATFIAENGCSNFYAAVNFLDSAGSVIGYGNATLPSLQPMQTATLEFDDTSNSAKSADMSQINCG